jgi:hypothetical protein
LSRQKKVRLGVLTALIAVVVALVLAEIIINLASPTEYLYPRYQFSAQYGLIPFANTRMVHGVPRRYQFHYTVNSMQSRGAAIAQGSAVRPMVVVLGDSYAFGMGVSDGEEFPTVMRKALAGRAEVVNLGSPGWGLTQEIRRFVERGVVYDPEIVVLQFCANDPEDNLTNRVTRFENGEFVFVDSENSFNLVKKFLSRSFLQRTQVYNFFRIRASIMAQTILVRREASKLEATVHADSTRAVTPVIEVVYVDLLEPFAARMRAEGRQLWLISVDHQLEQFPHIQASVRALHARGDLRYIEVTDWLQGREPYHSPEGHVWGATAHRLVGEGLAIETIASLADSSVVRP